MEMHFVKKDDRQKSDGGMDELEEALRQKDIMQEQFDLALHTADRPKKGLLKDIHSFEDYTYACYELLCKD